MINSKVLMSGADYFDDGQAINAYMDNRVPIDKAKAKNEHAAIKQALETAGIEVIKIEPPVDCQDGVYTANWALVHGDKAVMSTLPNARKDEEAYAMQVLSQFIPHIYKVPDGLHFSGQGDALPCGNYLLAGNGYRTEAAAHQFIADTLGYQVITLEAIPLVDENNQPVINAVSGWPDSFFYDIDLAIAVLREDLIAYCPNAFTKASQEKIASLPLEKIEVSLAEAQQAFACNLVSSGETVVMSAHAPELKAAIEDHGLKTITPEISELSKGGGYIRCTSLTLV